ncbi:MAG TPA: polyprenyl synthetase family protein [Trueperaceae bacterium]
MTAGDLGLDARSLEDELKEFEVELAEQLRSDVGFISAIGEDLVRAGGKRVRPTLSLLTGRLLNAPPGLARQVALAVELLHSASLLHDDLIDDATTRRGEQAAFLRYGNVVSVMSGDFMLARVLGLLARGGNRELTGLMAEAAAALCEGEVLQFQCATLKEWSYESYARVNDGKTAALMAAATEGVAALVGSETDVRSALRAFGTAYGRAFQLRDDYLDLLGDPERLGKPVGGDLREGKATYPALRLILEEDSAEAKLIVGRHASEPGDVERMAQLARSHGADAAMRGLITAEVEAAKVALAPFPPSAAKAALIDLAEQEVRRVA